jgi:hypothetical protein
MSNYLNTHFRKQQKKKELEERMKKREEVKKPIA